MGQIEVFSIFQKTLSLVLAGNGLKSGRLPENYNWSRQAPIGKASVSTPKCSQLGILAGGTLSHQLQRISSAMLSLFNFITVHSSYVYLLRNQHEFCEISKNNFFTKHFWATACVNKYSSIFISKFRENEEVFEGIKCSS